MPGFVSLQSLVEAIAGSVADAQTQVARGQIEGLASFLDKSGRPHTLDVRVPSIRPGAAPGEEDVYSAPLMALVPHAAMRIKQVEVTFAVELGDLGEDVPATGVATSAVDRATATRRSVSVNPTAGADAKARGTTANVTLLVECIDVPEGLARLMGEVVKTQGFRPSGDDGPGAPPSPPPTPPPSPPPPPPPPPRSPPAAEPKAADPATAAPRRADVRPAPAASRRSNPKT